MAYGNKGSNTSYGKKSNKGNSSLGSTFGAYGPGKKMGYKKPKQAGPAKMIGNGVTNSGSVG